MTATATAPRAPSRVRAFASLLVEIVAPFAVYYLLTRFGVGDVVALTAGGLVSCVVVVAVTVRRRHLDRSGLLVLVMFALSISLVGITGDPRFLLAKPAVFTGVAGLYCLATLKAARPLAHDTARPFFVGDDPAALAAWDRAWCAEPRLRGALRYTTAVWGIALIIDAVLRLVITYQLPLHTAVWAVQIPGIIALGGAAVISGRRMRRLQRLVQTRLQQTVAPGP